MDTIVNLCKARGYIYPGSEIYGGLSNTWDYGPLGVELKNNVKALWRKKFIQESKYNVGLDAAILMNPQTWVASGHVGGFSDPLIDCKECKTRHRADKLIEEWAHEQGKDMIADGMTDEEMIKFLDDNNICCPNCGKHNFTSIRKFNLMFKTFQGVTEDAKAEIYLRPETAQGIFVNFKNVMRTTRRKLPMGIAQIGKAYGTAKKSAFTGSAATIKNEKITSRQTSNVTNALAGQVAGVQTTSSTGQPGKDATVRIRGIGSISASNTPLYVVDGVPYDGEISAISTSDIESMTVLKDAASNALYGARGANGVILITTKRGKTGDARVTFDAKWGVNKRGIPSYETVSDPGKFYEMAYSAIYNADLKGYAAAGDLASANAYANKTMLSSSYLGYQVFTVPNGEQLIGMDGKLNPNATLGYSDGTYYYKPDNWSDELFENNLRQEYNLSVSGANDKMNYYMSAGYLDDQGIVPNSGFQRYSARLKADYQVKPWLKMSGNISFTHYDSREQDTESGTSNANAFYAANIMGAIYPMYIRDAEGNIMIDNRGFQRYDYGSDTNFQRKNVIPNANPLASYMLDLMKYSGDVVSGKWSADIDIWGGIKAKINIGIDANNVRSTDLVNPFYGQYSETSGVGGIVSVSTQRTFSTNQQYLLTYNKTFNHIHNLDVLAGHENYNYKYQYLYGSREKIYNPNLPELNNGIMNQSNASYSQSYATEGWWQYG